jgi:hypothetical protein
VPITSSPRKSAAPGTIVGSTVVAGVVVVVVVVVAGVVVGVVVGVALVVGTVVVASANEFVATRFVVSGAVDDAEEVVAVQEATITSTSRCRIVALTNVAAS